MQTKNDGDYHKISDVGLVCETSFNEFFLLFLMFTEI